MDFVEEETVPVEKALEEKALEEGAGVGGGSRGHGILISPVTFIGPGLA
jgi:hypothetical protein